jgi:hypothetical protein
LKEIYANAQKDYFKRKEEESNKIALDDIYELAIEQFLDLGGSSHNSS